MFNDALVKQVASLERRSWRHKLYTQMESVKIISMLNWIVHSALEKKFWGETLIVPPPKLKQRSDDSEISRRKDSEQVMKVKKDLKDLNPTDSDFPESGHGYSKMTPCVPITGYFGKNINNYGSIRKWCLCQNMGKEALHDYFPKI